MKACAWTCIVGGSLCLAFAGCSASAGGSGIDSGNNGSGARAGGGASDVDLGSGATLALGGGDGADPEPDTGCQTGGAEFAPKVPTVLLLVDRSGTMFKDAGNPWGVLRDSVLKVVADLNDQVRFGFVAVTGEQAAGMCPLLDEILPADSNYEAVKAKYVSLSAPVKGESPGMRGLERAAEILAADTTEGDKYVMFVTDGEQDFCNDGDFACPTDSVVHRLQTLAAQGFKTFIFGLPMTSTDAQAQARYPLVLQAFADAGAGAAVAPVLPPGGTGPINIFYNCQGVPEWQAEALAAGRGAMQTLGTYAAASGGTKVYTPDPTNEMALTQEIRNVLSGVKSCVFDIGGDIKVIQSRLDEAHVYVEGVEVPLDTGGANGWHMPTATQIELVGSACENWRLPQNNKIDWDFPCQILEPK
jgi:hypothetical protein